MNAFRCVRAVGAASSSLLRPSLARTTAAPQSATFPSSMRNMSLLSARRPMLPLTSGPSTLPAPGTTPSSTSQLPAADALDLASRLSAHPAMAGAMQIRCGPRDTYNPSHFVRKRRHGFLSRIRTKKGRKLLMRRLKKGRWNLSH
ncbi:hypothetical protein BS50DRAFT_575607 [Corynespora cassiicola Philippines]|uniref:Large ribosomal subunit protein bL34m n=1 Tax=Corynespora cassiicola Philippines TaxID=1448308 RepID=A0A2T2NJU9_CORCC|nr:hypothetical protein BS50DRAFT_575607 [Corynespora cassiicola Philippines]